MYRHWITVLSVLLISGALAPLPAQAPTSPATKTAPRPKISPEGRAALQAAKEVAAKVKGLEGDPRATALETAARAYDQVAVDRAAEPAVAANARFEAGELWRRHGSLVLAEKCYGEAARLDAQRYGQRATLLAADMQRRQKRTDEALLTYSSAEAMEPGSSRAQDARLWRARLLQSVGKLDEAIAVFQAAIESASGPRQTIEAANWLAKALIVRGDLEGADGAIRAADEAVSGSGEDDIVELERLQKALESMSARRALQRAKDKKNGAAKDATSIEDSRGR